MSSSKEKSFIVSVVKSLVESKLREVDLDSSGKTTYGSKEHLENLKKRLSEVEFWRDKQKKGSVSRVDYSRVAQRLKQELKSVERFIDRQKAKKSSKKKVDESLNLNNIPPEYNSVEDFVQFLLDDEIEEFTHEDLNKLNAKTSRPINSLRKELEDYGFKLKFRPNEKSVRGFGSNSHDRWHGPGSAATHGGAGIDPQYGVVTGRLK